MAAVLVCFVGVVGLRYVFAGVLAVPFDAGEVGRSARSRLKGMFGREAHLMSPVFRSALGLCGELGRGSGRFTGSFEGLFLVADRRTKYLEESPLQLQGLWVVVILACMFAIIVPLESSHGNIGQ